MLGRLHRNMSLVSKFKLLRITDLVDILVLFLFLFVLVILCASRLWRNFGYQLLVISEQLVRINLRNRVDWHIWVVVFEATMHEDGAINLPAGVAEALHCVEFVPFA